MNTNVVVLVGNLTKPAELHYTNSNKPVAKFTIAVNGYNNKVSFVPINVYGKNAESCHKYLDKGDKVCVIGSLEIVSYEKDGQSKLFTQINAESVEFLNSKKPEYNKEDKLPNPDKTEDDLPF